jgi:hypothetical protein
MNEPVAPKPPRFRTKPGAVNTIQRQTAPIRDPIDHHASARHGFEADWSRYLGDHRLGMRAAIINFHCLPGSDRLYSGKNLEPPFIGLWSSNPARGHGLPVSPKGHN